MVRITSKAEAIWTALVADQTLAGSMGKLIVDNLDEKVSAAKTLKNLAILTDLSNYKFSQHPLASDYTAVRAALLDQITALRLAELDAANLPADVDVIKGDTPYLADLALPGSPTSGSIGQLVKTNLDALISSRASATDWTSTLATDLAAMVAALTAARAAFLDSLDPLNFHYEFNTQALDTDLLALIGAGASYVLGSADNLPTYYGFLTGGGAGNVAGYSPGGCTKGRLHTPWMTGKTTVTWEANFKSNNNTNVQHMMGLFHSVPLTSYSEPADYCAHFFFDPGVSANWQARSYDSAELQTDTGVAFAGGFHVFKIVWSRTSVLFYIDGVLKATHATQIPSNPLAPEMLTSSVDANLKAILTTYVDVKTS